MDSTKSSSVMNHSLVPSVLMQVLTVLIVLATAPVLHAQSFQGLGDLSGGIYASNATGVSADGAVVVGYSSTSAGSVAFRWTLAEGMLSLGYLPGGDASSYARGVSGDGSVVVGQSDWTTGNLAFRWTAGNNMERLLGGDLLLYTDAQRVSADGSVIVGSGLASTVTDAFRWTAADGIKRLGDLDGGSTRSVAYGVSADGAVVVGSGFSASGAEAFRWVGNVMTGLDDLDGGTFSSAAYDVSGDGTIVVGSSSSASATSGQAFRWTVAGGMQPLDLVPGSIQAIAYTISNDGAQIGGFVNVPGAGQRAAIWSADGKVRLVQDVLQNDYGIDLSGWALEYVRDISGDGSILVGQGRNPAGQPEAWRAEISLRRELTYSLEVDPKQAAVDATVTVRVIATNQHAVSLTNVHPTAAMTATSNDDGEATLLTGPTPSAIPTLDPNAKDTLVYTFKATKRGHVTFAVSIEGTDPSAKTVKGINKCAPPCGVLTIIGPGFIVNSIDDDVDTDPGDGKCSTGQMVEIDGKMVPECTLRAAIQEAEVRAGSHEISFAIPGAGAHIIRPGTPGLPTIHVHDPLMIDATTQPGYVGTPLVVIDGGNLGTGDGLTIVGGEGSTIRGLVIGNFPNAALVVRGSENTLIEGNYIGLDATGAQGMPNAVGIGLEDASFTRIRKNVLSGNGTGLMMFKGSNNQITNNRIGTNAAGTAALGNTKVGVEVASGAQSFTIGGQGPDEGNLISGNKGPGIRTRGMGVIEGNRIGTNAEGRAPIPNTNGGIQATADAQSDIRGNLISGNAEFGVLLGLLEAGNLRTGYSRLTGNRIGTDDKGTAVIRNEGPGVWLIAGIAEATVGGDPRNVISGNAGPNILITNESGITPTASNRIAGNLIGTDISGTQALDNKHVGIHVQLDEAGYQMPNGLVIGNESVHHIGNPPSNVIAGNSGGGILITSARGITGTLALNVTVADNYIGTDISGTQALGNNGTGIKISDATGVLVEANLISSNQGTGVGIDGNISYDGELRIQHNVIGSDVTQQVPLANLFDGINIRLDISTPLLGTSTPLVRVFDNTVAGNEGHGISVSGGAPSPRLDSRMTNVQIIQNRIGCTIADNSTVVPMGNGKAGVYLEGDHNLVGNFFGDETEPFRNANIIAHNSGTGIVVASGNRHDLRGNLIFSNGLLGIDLNNDGATENDDEDADDGPNGLTNFPFVSTAFLANGEVFLRGAMKGAGAQTYTMDFHIEATGIYGFDVAQGYLGSQHVFVPIAPSDTRGFNARFKATAWVPVPGGLNGHELKQTAIQPGWGVSNMASHYSLLDNVIANTSEFAVERVTINPAPEVTSNAAAGDDRIEITNSSDFSIGDEVTICPACSNEETGTISGFGSLIFKKPLQFAHAAGESVVPFTRSVDALLVHSDTLAYFHAGTAASLRFTGVTGAGHVAVERLRRGPATTEGITQPTVLEHRWIASLDSTLAFTDSTEIWITHAGIPLNRVDRPSEVTIYHRPTPGTGAFTPLATRYNDTLGVFIGRGFRSLGEFVLATSSTVSGVEERVVPQEFALFEAYPNPFSGTTTFKLDMPQPGQTTVAVYDALGRRVAVLLDAKVNAGTYSLQFNAQDLPSGIYHVRAITPQGVRTRGVAVVR